MTTPTLLIVLAVVLALLVSVGVFIPTRAKPTEDPDLPPAGQVESELLRRPLRSRQRV